MTLYNLGALKLTAAVILTDIFLLLVLIGILPETRDFGDWLKNATVVVVFRTVSGQPLFLLGLLRLFRQRLDDFSPTWVTTLSFMTSIASTYVIGLFVGVLTHGSSGTGADQVMAAANELIVRIFTTPLWPNNPMVLLLGLLLSPWIVSVMHAAWSRSDGQNPV